MELPLTPVSAGRAQQVPELNAFSRTSCCCPARKTAAHPTCCASPTPNCGSVGVPLCPAACQRTEHRWGVLQPQLGPGDSMGARRKRVFSTPSCSSPASPSSLARGGRCRQGRFPRASLAQAFGKAHS